MEPRPRKALLVAGACILGLAGLTLLAGACLPYAALKGLADNLSGDGNFTRSSRAMPWSTGCCWAWPV